MNKLQYIKKFSIIGYSNYKDFHWAVIQINLKIFSIYFQ